MILSGANIAACRAAGDIAIEPFFFEQLNPASYDLTLGDELCVYTRPHAFFTEGCEVANPRQLPLAPDVLDAKRPNRAARFRLSAEHGFLVTPGRVFLMHSRERVWSRRFVPVVDGKSSIGRLGIAVHITAGFGDPGFDGQYTLEVVALGEAVVLYPGMRIAQIRFHLLEGPAADYQQKGHYTGGAAIGPIPSRSYLQFDREPKTDPAPAPPPGSGEHPAVRLELPPSLPEPASDGELRRGGYDRADD